MIKNLTTNQTFDAKGHELNYWYISAFIGETCIHGNDLWKKIC